MTGVRIFFFVLAAVAMVLIVAFELSTMAFLRNAAGTGESMPGLGGPYLALLDGILLYSVIRMGVDQLRIQKVRLKMNTGPLLRRCGAAIAGSVGSPSFGRNGLIRK